MSLLASHPTQVPGHLSPDNDAMATGPDGLYPGSGGALEIPALDMSLHALAGESSRVTGWDIDPQVAEQEPPQTPSSVHPAALALGQAGANPLTDGTLHGALSNALGGVTPGMDTFDPSSFASLHSSDGRNGGRSPSPPKTIMAYAKLGFPDGNFYINTKRVVIGRDLRLHKMLKGKSREASTEDALHAIAKDLGSGSHTGHISAAQSQISESGGIVGPSADSLMALKSRRSRNTASESQDSHSDVANLAHEFYHPLAPSVAADARLDKRNGTTINHTTEFPPDFSSFAADPNEVPFVSVHNPVGPNEKSHGSISRNHLSIYYHVADQCWRMEVLGKNGAFLDGVHYSRGEDRMLENGNIMQIGGVRITFSLPENAIQDDSRSEKMSVSFEDEEGNEIDTHISGESEDDFEQPEYHYYGSQAEFDDEEDEEEAEGADDEDEEDEDSESAEEVEYPKRTAKPSLKLRIKEREPEKPPATDPRVKHKGGKTKPTAAPSKQEKPVAGKQPSKTQKKEASKKNLKITAKVNGRPAPPKAKSPEAAASSAAEESDAASPTVMPSTENISRERDLINGVDVNVPGLPMGIVIPARPRGPGRPSKEFLSKREKQQLLREYKERKRREEQGLDPNEVTPAPQRVEADRMPKNEADEEQPREPRPPAEKPAGYTPKVDKAPKRERSPSPEMRITDYTPEQLKAPSKPYVVIIYEVLSNSPQPLNLKSIYKRIMLRYPHYKFSVDGNGWQSSVRHNLAQHPCFRKVEKDGKGWLWGIDPNEPFDKDRKRRAEEPLPNPRINGPRPVPPDEKLMFILKRGLMTPRPESQPPEIRPDSAMEKTETPAHASEAAPESSSEPQRNPEASGPPASSAPATPARTPRPYRSPYTQTTPFPQRVYQNYPAPSHHQPVHFAPHAPGPVPHPSPRPAPNVVSTNQLRPFEGPHIQPDLAPPIDGFANPSLQFFRLFGVTFPDYTAVGFLNFRNWYVQNSTNHPSQSLQEVDHAMAESFNDKPLPIEGLTQLENELIRVIRNVFNKSRAAQPGQTGVPQPTLNGGAAEKEAEKLVEQMKGDVEAVAVVGSSSTAAASAGAGAGTSSQTSAPATDAGAEQRQGGVAGDTAGQETPESPEEEHEFEPLSDSDLSSEDEAMLDALEVQARRQHEMGGDGQSQTESQLQAQSQVQAGSQVKVETVEAQSKAERPAEAHPAKEGRPQSQDQRTATGQTVTEAGEKAAEKPGDESQDVLMNDAE